MDVSSSQINRPSARANVLRDVAVIAPALFVTFFFWTYPVIPTFQPIISAFLPLRLIQKGTLNFVVPWIAIFMALCIVKNRYIAIATPLFGFLIVIAGSSAIASWVHYRWFDTFDLTFVCGFVWRDAYPNSIGLTVTTAWAIWITRPRHPPSDCCQTCGYNLTGNVSGVCPECGTKFTASCQSTVTLVFKKKES
jgi:hypothetical protein